MSEVRNFGFLVKEVSRGYTRRFEERARSIDLTLSQCKVLVYLARQEGVSQARLCEMTELEPMNVVRILDHMEAAGWLERRPDPLDRRARQLFLKPESAPLIDEIWLIAEEVREESFVDMAPQHVKLLVTLLEKAHQNLLAADAASSLAASGTGVPPTKTNVRATRARSTVKS